MNWFIPYSRGEHMIEEDCRWEYDRWDLPGEWLPMHYYEALNCLFRIENALRLLVYVGLKRGLGANWMNVSLSAEDGEKPRSLPSIAKWRAGAEQKFEYLTKPLTCPLMYLTAGELVNLILSDSYWKFFKPYFPGAPEIMRAKLQEIAVIRNALAHFRPVTKEQVEVIKQNGSQVLGKFQEEFDELVFGVPQKLFHRWNTECLIPVVCDTTTFKCIAQASKSGRWVHVTMYSHAYVLKVHSSADACSIECLALNIDKLLRAFPAMQGVCVIATMDARAASWNGDSALPPIVIETRLSFPKSENSPATTEFVPEELVHEGTGDPPTLDIFSKHTIRASEHKMTEGPEWLIQAWQINERAKASEFVENWAGLASSQTEGDSLTALPRYPWMTAYISKPC